MSAPLCVIAAGGTGGHMFPAQALAEALLARGWRVMLSTDARGARYTSGFPDAVEIEEVPSATFARGGMAAKAMAPVQIGRGVARAIRRFRTLRPALVAGFGGYPTIPALAAATALRMPRMIHEQNGVLGRVNRVFATRVPVVACGIWPTALPEGAKAVHVGNPVRASIHERSGAPYIAPGERSLSLLVIGGSQGARVLSQVVPEAVAHLAEPLRSALRVSHQARREDTDRVSRIYAEAGVATEVRSFFDDIPDRMSRAQLVISRAGASSIADLTVIGRPSILVPFAAAAADHQSANARALSEAEAAVVIPEDRLTAQALAGAVETILSQPRTAERMAAQALSLGRPDAARDLADLAETIAGMDNTNKKGTGQP